MSGALDTGTLVPGLVASAPHRLPFGDQLDIRAFLLDRPAGNLLIYSAPTLDGDERAVGIEHWYLNHWHEAMFAAHLDAPLHVHRDDRAQTDKRMHVRASFSRRHVLGEDFEVIPIPGHTPGATAYLWNSGEHRMLFTGDTLYLHDGEWVTAVLDSSDRAAYADSLRLIRELDFDVLVPWAAQAGRPPHAFTDPVDRARRIDALIERLQD